MHGKIQIVTRCFPKRLHASILNFGIQLLTCNIKVSIHKCFKTRVLLKKFDAEFPAKMAAETVTRSIGKWTVRNLAKKDVRSRRKNYVHRSTIEEMIN